MTDDISLPFGTTAEAEAAERSNVDSPPNPTLETEFRLRSAHVKREEQRSELRMKAYTHAAGVVLGLAFYVAAAGLVFATGGGENVSDEAQIAIFGTPVVAIAAITIFILKGVFSGFSEKSISEDSQVLSTLGTNGGS
ncbi:hypothetical protein [Celeribacter sp.]|uniref:hypothetical protein n=1 Tax=Celeribacter sp. TaxID=1890673 RepID=UPI003A925145